MPDDAEAPARHQSIKALLLAALELSSAERGAWLAALEARDGAAATTVRQLLDAHTRAGTFLDLPDDDDAAPTAAGRLIGRFVVERELGHGGMGTVFLGAHREHGFVQHVAIKVLGANLAHGAADRLRDERRILATLNHPGIAHFVDGGATADGLPYIAMEYVDGRPITSWCDDERLEPRARLRLFLKVCRAVHFAHQRLVVHRDIKPSNILVTADGTPKLLDFGIAKLLDAGNPVPGAGTALVLTPHYASPEQVSGSGTVTTATDVYSLGVLLYELLTGGGPYRTVTTESSPLAVLDAVRSAEPERPSSAAARHGRRALDGDVEAVLLRALRKDPAARYGSAEQFAQDVERYLDGQPVVARAGSAAYRARKFVSRNRAVAAAAAVAAVSLSAATAVSIWQARVANAQRLQAETRFNDVRALANAFVFEFDEAVREIPGTTAARRLVITRSLAYLEKLASDVQNDVPLRRELAAAYQRVGDVQGNPYLQNLGERREALESYRHALVLREQIAAGPEASDADAQELASALGAVGDLMWSNGDFPGALAQYERAASITRTLAARATSSPPAVAAAARYAYLVGQALTKLGRFGDAESQYARAVAMMEAVAERGVLPSAVERLHPVAVAKVGDGLLRRGRVAEAIDAYDRAATALEALTRRDPGSAAFQRVHAFLLLRVAFGQAVAGQLPEAADIGQRVLHLQRTFALADANNRQVQSDLALTTSTLGGIALERGRLAEARTALAESVAVFARLGAAGAGFADLRSDYAVALRRQGDVAAKAGDHAKAFERYRLAIDMLEATPRDGEYAAERALVHLRASVVAPTGTEASQLRAEALAEWARVQTAGVRTWMGEFNGAARLSEAMSAATSGSRGSSSTPASSSARDPA